MDIQDIRNVFSKAIVTIQKDCAVIIYVLHHRSFSQCIKIPQKEHLSELISMCDRIELKADPGKSIKLSFFGRFGFEPGIYHPVTPEVTSEMLHTLLEILDQAENDDLHNLRRVDRAQQDISHPITFRPASRWGALKKISEQIPLTGSYARSAELPDQDFAGNIIYEFGTKYSREVEIQQEMIPDIVKMVETSTEMDIKGSVMEGEVRITFWG